MVIFNFASSDSPSFLIWTNWFVQGLGRARCRRFVTSSSASQEINAPLGLLGLGCGSAFRCNGMAVCCIDLKGVYLSRPKETQDRMEKNT